jgi:methionyl-tRNA formyltransferase
VRIVILAPSIYSETACAMAANLAHSGYVPIGAIALRSLHYLTLQRKLAQWGTRQFFHYARTKLLRAADDAQPGVVNPYLHSFLRHESQTFRSLCDLGAHYNFPVVVCRNQNDRRPIALLGEWSPDLIVFTGGNILRNPLLDIPRLGVLNVHLGLLPEVRGMSAPEWSLLTNVPPGITLHCMDTGIDTGPVLGRFELPEACNCTSLIDLRNRLVALGVEKTVEIVGALDRGLISVRPQSQRYQEKQYFVMHELLEEHAAKRLTGNDTRALSESAHA